MLDAWASGLGIWRRRINGATGSGKGVEMEKMANDGGGGGMRTVPGGIRKGYGAWRSSMNEVFASKRLGDSICSDACTATDEW